MTREKGIRIVFVCGSLEPGKNGVGDYAMQLATEVVNQGGEAALVAINDEHTGEILDAVQNDLSCLRLPATMTAKARFRAAKIWIDQYNPQWISLQFVLFSFHQKGLPLGLSAALLQLGAGRKWHIMFHELWVGMDQYASKKLRLWGGVQRQIIRSLLHKLQPSAVHTQAHLYQFQLERLGVTVKQLPLFSNIPVTVSNDNVSAPPKNLISLLLFGGIHPDAPIEDFAGDIDNYRRVNKVDICLKVIGRSGGQVAEWKKVWAAKKLPFEIIGEVSAGEISKLLVQGTLGISTTPIALVEKSGAVAAMLAHGLPVLCVRNAWQARGYQSTKSLPGVMEYRPGNFSSHLKIQRPKVNLAVGNVAKIFLRDLAGKEVPTQKQSIL